MNERHEQLMAQAWIEFAPDAKAVTKRFAELIVKKFDDILLLEWLDCIANDDKKSVLLLDRIREKTKTYFGVEE
jgi:hypothetical protein